MPALHAVQNATLRSLFRSERKGWLERLLEAVRRR